jgi:hypothetical protein
LCLLYWTDKVATAIARAGEYDDSVQDDWCCHIQYQDLLTNPKLAVEKISAHFGKSMSSLHKQRINSWLSQRSQHSEGTHACDPADFGWTAASLE